MHATTASAPAAAHKDNIFGICNAIGEDFGFNPFFLRLAFAIALLASPEITLASYAGLGILVLVSRLATRRWRTVRGRPAQQAEPWSTALPVRRVADRIDAGKVLQTAL